MGLSSAQAYELLQGEKEHSEVRQGYEKNISNIILSKRGTEEHPSVLQSADNSRTFSLQTLPSSHFRNTELEFLNLCLGAPCDRLL